MAVAAVEKQIHGEATHENTVTHIEQSETERKV
jgi:hypothetical protein